MYLLSVNNSLPAFDPFAFLDQCCYVTEGASCGCRYLTSQTMIHFKIVLHYPTNTRRQLDFRLTSMMLNSYPGVLVGGCDAKSWENTIEQNIRGNNSFHLFPSLHLAVVSIRRLLGCITYRSPSLSSRPTAYYIFLFLVLVRQAQSSHVSQTLEISAEHRTRGFTTTLTARSEFSLE